MSSDCCFCSGSEGAKFLFPVRRSRYPPPALRVFGQNHPRSPSLGWVPGKPRDSVSHFMRKLSLTSARQSVRWSNDLYADDPRPVTGRRPNRSRLRYVREARRVIEMKRRRLRHPFCAQNSMCQFFTKFRQNVHRKGVGFGTSEKLDSRPSRQASVSIQPGAAQQPLSEIRDRW